MFVTYSLQRVSTCYCRARRKLLPYLSQLFVHACLLLLLVLAVPDVRDEDLPIHKLELEQLTGPIQQMHKILDLLSHLQSTHVDELRHDRSLSSLMDRLVYGLTQSLIANTHEHIWQICAYICKLMTHDSHF